MGANGNGDDEHKTRPSADEAMAMLGALLGQMLDRLVAAHAGATTPLLERIERLESKVAKLKRSARDEPGDTAEPTSSEPGEMLVFGTGERIASTDRVFSGEAGALLLKWKREADAAMAEAAREIERLAKLEEARLLDERAEAWAWGAMIAGRRVQ